MYSLDARDDQGNHIPNVNRGTGNISDYQREALTRLIETVHAHALKEVEGIVEETPKQEYMRWVAAGQLTFGACAECGNYISAEWAEYEGEAVGYLCATCRFGPACDGDDTFYAAGDYPDGLVDDEPDEDDEPTGPEWDDEADEAYDDEEAYCSNCGDENPEDSGFCRACEAEMLL